MASQFCLLGPSELRRPNLPKTNRTLMTISELQHPSLSCFKPLLEFVFDEIRHAGKQALPAAELNDLGAMAWKVGPLQTLKLIFGLRAAGRLDDDDFYRTIFWVYKNHPLTLALNLRVFGELGLFKDLAGILQKVLQQSISEGYHSFGYGKLESEKEEGKSEEVVAAWRRADGRSKAKIAVERYLNDRRYQGLHCQVADIFAEFLKSDLKYLKSGEIANISSAAKFCPSLDSKYDKETLVCESIAKRVFPREEYEEYREISDPQYGYRVRDRLRKQVLVCLRHALMSSQPRNDAGRKTEMAAEVVKGLKSMEMYRKILYSEGSNLLKQCMKIVGMYSDGLKLPHQVMISLINGQSSDEIAEIQWQQLIRGLSKKRKLRNCVAVCDISESMRGTSKELVCIAMGLLISELSDYPWKGKVFSFSHPPKLHKIEGENLRSKCEFMKQNMLSAKKLNFGEIYDRVLDMAIIENLKQHQIPERIFVFTDKDFDTAFKNDWFDDYAKAYFNYRKGGYGLKVPDMVLWNLKGSVAKPVALYNRAKGRDVGMILTGFSSSLLKLFLYSELDSRSSAPQVQVPYGFSCSFAPHLVPKLEPVLNCAVSGDELKNLLVFD